MNVDELPDEWRRVTKRIAFSKFCLETFMPNLVSLTHPKSPDIENNSNGSISDIRISRQSLIKENCHNSRISIDMKLGLVSLLDKQNKTTSRLFDYGFIAAKCNAIVIFAINDRFGAIQKPDFERMVCKTYIVISSNLLPLKMWKQNKNFSNTDLLLLLWVKVHQQN